MWTWLVVPYVPLVLATALLAGKIAVGAKPDAFEILTALLIFSCVALRQAVALAEAIRGRSSQALAARRSFEEAVGDFRPSPPLLPAAERPTHQVGLLAGPEAERQLDTWIAEMVRIHNRHIESLRRSGNWTTVWTFAGGVVLGVFGSIVVALLVR